MTDTNYQAFEHAFVVSMVMCVCEGAVVRHGIVDD